MATSLNSYLYLILHQYNHRLKQKQAFSPAFTDKTLGFLPQWRNHRIGKTKAAEENLKIQEKAAREYVIQLFTEAELKFKQLKNSNQQKILQEILQNEQQLSLLLFLTLFRSQKKLWWRMLLQQRYRKNLQRRLKRKRISSYTLKSREERKVRNDASKRNKPHTHNSAEIFWLRNLHANHYYQKQKTIKKKTLTPKKTFEKNFYTLFN